MMRSLTIGESMMRSLTKGESMIRNLTKGGHRFVRKLHGPPAPEAVQ